MLKKAQDDDLVMNLVELALARPSDERESYLQSACSTEPELLDQVRKYVEWDQRMDGFLLDPLYSILSEHHFEPGDVLDGRFRIVREVAQGGMGVVYEAWDEKLERRIAVKCAKAGFRKRLPPEVRNARDITHPNVCKIFEIHTATTEQGEIDFLAMEFLDGETLAERLHKGPLPKEEAITIARQLSAGLAEAHRDQVVHGDLKSGNVILTKAADGALRAVITDFGLARRPDVAQRTMQSGEAGGTPDYMAPELLRGEKATTASDVYALGVILHELVAGRRPPAASEEKRLGWKLAAVHPKWDHILTRCLDPDPARRFRDGAEVEQALAPPRSRRWLLGAAAAVVLAIASGIATHHQATAPQESVSLALLPFGSDPDTAPIAERLLRDASAQLSGVKSSARTKFAFIPARVTTPEKARTSLGATHVLHGTLGKENGRIILHAYLTDARSLVKAKDWKVDYAPGDMRYAPVALAGMVTGTFRLPALAIGATVNAAARLDYLAGLSYLRRNSTVDAALAALERAVAADSDSPLTYAALAEAQRWKFITTDDRLWLDRAQQSEREAERRNADLTPVHLIAGLLLYDTGFYELAATEYRRSVELEPGNTDAYRRLGQVYERNNQLDEALAAYRKAVEIGPDYHRNYESLGSFYYKRANYSEAVKQFRKEVECVPNEPNAHFALGTAYWDLGDYKAAESELGLAIRLGEGDNPSAVINLALVLMHQSRDREAVEHLTLMLKRWPGRYRGWLSLATAYRRLGLPVDSERANRNALALVEKEMTWNPRDGKIRSSLAYLCARLGDQRRAESEIAQALQLSPGDADVNWMAAWTYEALGQRQKALDILSSSPDGVLASLSRWPDMADLSKDPRFQSLLAARQIR
jgi:serine/threonine protein kinase/tetratricopeptide (TPR) repeat protein